MVICAMVAIAPPTAEINDQPAHFAGATAISYITLPLQLIPKMCGHAISRFIPAYTGC